MRIKNFTLLFLMGIFGLFTTNLFAQQDATIAPDQIKYWIGEGENEVIFIVNWNTPVDTALAWGYRFAAESVTIKDVMDDIAAVDHRFSYDSPNGSWLNDIFFYDGVLDLRLTSPGWISYLVDGESSINTFDQQTLVNGNYVKWGDTYCGTMVDQENWIYVWEKEVAPVYPLADEAMIDASQILYWIGTGSNQVIFAVNFAEPHDVCFAWGYRFSTDDVIIEHMMDEIATADGRFDYHGASGWLTDITFVNGEDNYLLQGSNTMYNVNGVSPWYGYSEVAVHNGDFVKFGDYRIGTEIAPWTYVWETPVQAVTAYDAVAENDVTLSLYPNPATSYTTLSMSEMSDATVTISDLQGRVLRSFAVNQTGEPVRIETDGFKAGFYFVTVSDGSSRQTVKLSVR